MAEALGVLNPLRVYGASEPKMFALAELVFGRPLVCACGMGARNDCPFFFEGPYVARPLLISTHRTRKPKVCKETQAGMPVLISLSSSGRVTARLCRQAAIQNVDAMKMLCPLRFLPHKYLGRLDKQT